MKEKKPPVIKIRLVKDGTKHPDWNYAHYTDFSGRNQRLEPCCKKSKPCWECK